MSDEVGKGFARRITQSNLSDFAQLLRDRTKTPDNQILSDSAPSGSQPGSGTPELAPAQLQFSGSRVQVDLPFTFSWGTSGPSTVTDPSKPGLVSAKGEIPGNPNASCSVLVAEIPGPGRWTQVSFSKEVFHGFFGAGTIGLEYTDANGTLKHETASAIVKKSSNYCYELGAAMGLGYPSVSDGRPIGVFLRLELQQFRYGLVMPSDPGHTILDSFLAEKWTGPAGRMRRVVTDLETLLEIWPAAPLPLTVSGSDGS